MEREDERPLLIGEVARLTGFPTKTLRFYDELGLVRPGARTEAGYRLYGPEEMAKLEFVKQAKLIGLRLGETAELVGVGQVPLSDHDTIARSFSYDLCYQPSGGGAITNFTANNYPVAHVRDSASWTAAATTVPGAGTWRVGFCVKTHNAFDMDDTDFVNGWVQVVNP